MGSSYINIGPAVPAISNIYLLWQTVVQIWLNIVHPKIVLRKHYKMN